MAEYTMHGKKYVITESLDQNGYPRKEVFILEEGDRLSIPEADDPYYRIFDSFAHSQLPSDLIIELGNRPQS